jgi:DNA-binding MarR family transcriptional regulator
MDFLLRKIRRVPPPLRPSPTVSGGHRTTSTGDPRELAPLGIELWELELLAALRRSEGPPYRLTAGALLEEAQLTSGAITKRVAHLERKGWVRREIYPEDRRQILVILTDEGLKRARSVFGVMSKIEEALLERLGERPWAG